MNVRQETFNIDQAKKEITKLGLPFLPVAEDFLAKYGGTYVYRYVGLRGKQTQVCHFDVSKALSHIDFAWFGFYKEKLKQEFTPIGEFSNGHMTLMMLADGSVYGGFDHFVAKLGNAGEDVLLNFCNQDKKGQKVDD